MNHGKNYISTEVETGHAFLSTTPQGKMHVQRGYFMPKGRKQSLQTSSVIKLHHISSLLDEQFFLI